MGRFTSYRLDTIKTRLLHSGARELKNFCEFIEAQSQELDNKRAQADSMPLIVIEVGLIEKMKKNVPRLNAEDVETLIVFAEQQIHLCRISDKADRIVGNLGIEEYYLREERYTEIETYIFKLTLG